MSESTPTPAATAELSEHRWIYLGQRLLSTNKLSHVFLTHLDTEASFDFKQSFGAIGSIYIMTCTADAARTYTSGINGPRWAGLHDRSDPRLVDWTAKHRADTTQYEQLRAEAKSKKDADSISDLVAPLRDLYRKRIGHARRAAFLAVVIEELTQ